MGWESSDVFRFDLRLLFQCQLRIAKLRRAYNSLVRFNLGPLLQDQTRIAKLKSAYNSLIIDPRGLQCETNL